MIRPNDYIDLVRREYLGNFVRAGGAAVKFVVPTDAAVAEDARSRLRAAAQADGFVYARVDAAETRVHMIDRVFFAVARQVDWRALASFVVNETLAELRFRLPDGVTEPTLEAIARANDYDYFELRRDFKQRLQAKLFRDYRMAREFRIAVGRLCEAQVDGTPASRATSDSVIQWLTGDLQKISALKSALIFQKIGRHNARHMLFSLARWLTRAGRSGLVLDLDVRQLAVAHRADAGPDAIHYTKAGVLDAYEVLRQLIDATDELESCFTMVTCAPEFVTDLHRGVQAYHALKLRIWDDVRDALRANPYSALIRLTPDAPHLPVIP